MVKRFWKTAASVFSLAAFSFAPASTQSGTFQVLDVIEGRWGWVVPEGEESTASCARGGVRIWLSEDRTVYYSQYPDMDGPNVASILQVQQNWILIQYVDEERTTDSGELVSWILFMTGEDRFVWIRHDWIGVRRSTRPLERCVSANLT